MAPFDVRLPDKNEEDEKDIILIKPRKKYIGVLIYNPKSILIFSSISFNLSFDKMPILFINLSFEIDLISSVFA